MPTFNAGKRPPLSTQDSGLQPPQRSDLFSVASNRSPLPVLLAVLIEDLVLLLCIPRQRPLVKPGASPPLTFVKVTLGTMTLCNALGASLGAAFGSPPG